MNPLSIAAASNAEFELRVQQAIQSAMYSTSQVAVLLLAFDNPIDDYSLDTQNSSTLQNSILLRLRSGLRESDTVSLLDNGQMGILLRSVQSPQDVNLVINRLLNQLLEPAHTDGLTISLNPRLGIAVFPDHAETVEGIIEHATNDLELAIAKNKSHNIYKPQAQRRITSRLWMSELRQAIIRDQLFLTFQPKISLSRPRVTGVEVLVRWQHPEHGIIMPDQFVPFAERTGLIIPMTLWVLQQSLLQCRAWHEINLDMSVAVNLSMWNLEAQELPDQIEALLRDTQVSPDSLELEITETSIMNDPQRVIQTLSKIRDLGVRFTIDDFGTGYSSFAYLTKLPVSCIKIDKSFVQNIQSDRDSSVIVKAIIDLSHNLGLKVVAEGVETAAAKEILRSFECDEGQGYHFCRPITAEMMTKYLLDPPTTVTERSNRMTGNWRDLREQT
jgi:EAL domain-containing protein (putative c-di-GMP-specific phosphodiesterase class I)/GGDEF domain-containing protein